MNKLNYFKLISLIGFVSIGLTLSAQAPYWKLNGNPNFGSDAVNNTNNTLGTNDNFSLNFSTNNTQSFATYTVQSCQNTPPKTLPLAH